jgi:2-C-methyl-D-erythritol 4-phosphate cytidylyltransferase
LSEGLEDAIIVAGGKLRQQSVANALERVESDFVVVHDAARPFVTADLVRAVLVAVESADGAVPTVPVEETLKEVEGTLVRATISRSGVHRAQTPQAFRTEALRRAHERALSDGAVATDDAALIERYEGSVVTVPGSSRNIKITNPEDLEMAEAMMRLR